jgi:hypothetical protein
MTTVGSIVLETLRLYPAVPQISRVAAADVLLQSQATPPLQGTAAEHSAASGVAQGTVTTLRLRKGTAITIPIVALHRDSVSACRDALPVPPQ